MDDQLDRWNDNGGSGEDGSGFWYVGSKGKCWVCGDLTSFAWLDVGYQHRDCDAYPSPEGDVVIIKGVKQ